MLLEKPGKIYLVGIGGIGISALARYLHDNRFTVEGSDLAETEITAQLIREGITVHRGSRAEDFPVDAALLIYSSAVPENDPQRQKAAAAGISQISYPQALGEVAKDYKVLAVSGTNGKTTTTAMAAVVLAAGGFDPTVIVGSKVNAWGANYRRGKSEWLVVEADEYRRGFLNLNPDILVITNIAADHLDYYQDLADIKAAFRELITNMKPGGVLIYNYEDANTREVVADFPWRKISFGVSEGDITAEKFPGLRLKLPGQFNLANALAAVAACKTIGCRSEQIILDLNNFTGTWRRFQLVGKLGQTDIVSDYAHHPAGLSATLAAATERYDPQQTLVIFQPHQHNRTAKLYDEFVQALAAAPQTDFILAEIFEVAGRMEEQERAQISSQKLVEALREKGKHANYAADIGEAETLVREALHKKPYKAIIILGAGNIYQIANKLAKNN